MPSSKIKNILFFLLKISLSLAILGFLVYQALKAKDAGGKPIFLQLLHEEKRWDFLFLGACFSFFAVLTTIVRWWWLVRTQGLPAKFSDTLRIGFIGYLFNLAPMGIVGGDLLKAWLLTKHQKEHPGAGSAVLAAVFMDRVIGLYALFLTAGAVLLACGILTSPETSPVIRGIGVAVCAAAGIGTLLFLIILGPDLSGGKFTEKLSTLPRVGPALERIVLSIRRYQNHLGVFSAATLMSVMVHVLFAVSIFFLTAGVFRENLPFTQMLWVSPTSMSASAIPLPAGPFEAVLDTLFQAFPGMHAGQGLAVALVYRLVSLLIASLGVVFYFSARGEIREVVRENEKETSPAGTAGT